MVKKKRERDEYSRDITSFLTEEPSKAFEAKEEVKEGPVFDDFSDLVYEYMVSRGGEVAKSELYRWAKENKVPMISLYKALQSLLLRSRIKRMFSENKEEIVYRTSS